MSTHEYVGARYVPIFADPVEWDINRAYEPLTIVTYNNDCYTSKIPVPAGIQITNTTYWVNSSNFNAKIAELFSKFPVSIEDGGTGASTVIGARTNLDAAQSDGASNTLYTVEQIAMNNALNISSVDTRVDRGNGEASGDYNDYISMGVWTVNGKMTANKPSPDHALSGVLVVYAGFNPARTVPVYTAQLYMATNGQVFFRVYLDSANTWNPWFEISATRV